VISESTRGIVDNIQDDKKSLKAFSLVCNAWTNPAHDHLFASLIINETIFDPLGATKLNATSIFTP
jgi:hypothetical protein